MKLQAFEASNPESLQSQSRRYAKNRLSLSRLGIFYGRLDKAESQDTSRYLATPYRDAINRVLKFVVVDGRQGYPPAHVAKFVETALTARKPRARYSIVPKPLEAWLLTQVFSPRRVDRLLAKQFGLRREVSDGLQMVGHQDRSGG
jgi:hypothetical protein